MQPQGRRHKNFPRKTKEFFGKGVRMWWEPIFGDSKTAEKQLAKKEIEAELIELEADHA